MRGFTTNFRTVVNIIEQLRLFTHENRDYVCVMPTQPELLEVSQNSVSSVKSPHCKVQYLRLMAKPSRAVTECKLGDHCENQHL